jgi:hypothetical protein
VGVLRSGRLVAQAPTERLLAGLRRYHVDADDAWRAPPEIEARLLRRDSGLGNSLRLVAAGDEADMSAVIAASGARLLEVSRLSLAESVPVLLQSERHHDFA